MISHQAVIVVVGIGIAGTLGFTFGWPGLLAGLSACLAIVGYYRKDLTGR